MSDFLFRRLRVLEASVDVKRWTSHVEEARLFWKRGDLERGAHLLRSLCTQLEEANSDEARNLLPDCLALVGDWLSEMKADSPKTILDNFLEKVYNILD